MNFLLFLLILVTPAFAQDVTDNTYVDAVTNEEQPPVPENVCTADADGNLSCVDTNDPNVSYGYDSPAVAAEKVARQQAEAAALAKQKQIQDINKQLDDIDSKEVRPVAAITAAQALGNVPNESDKDRLISLEAQKSALRGQLATLQGN